MIRVLPRDAFNDASLLKCIGKLSMLIEDGIIPFMSITYDGEPFDVQQNDSDGSTYVANIQFYIKKEPIDHFRPMNSREQWPLYLRGDDDDVAVFDDDGEFDLSIEE